MIVSVILRFLCKVAAVVDDEKVSPPRFLWNRTWGNPIFWPHEPVMLEKPSFVLVQRLTKSRAGMRNARVYDHHLEM